MSTTYPGKPSRVILPPCGLLLLLSLSSLLFTNHIKAQCSVSSVIHPGNIINDGSYGDIAFSNPGNAIASDNSRATANVLALLLSGTTNYLKATNFGFAIPSTASICGIRVEVEKRAGGLGIGAWIRDDRVRLIKGGTVTGSNLAIAGDWSGTEAYHTYGGITNLWGTTLTPADVNASNFGVAMSAEFLGLLFVLPSIQVDDIRMTVYFNIVLPVQLISFNAVQKNNIASLEWKMVHSETNGSITVQRLVPGETEWADMARYNMEQGTTEKTYNYSEPLEKKGNYLYRLAITTATQRMIYSKTEAVFFEGITGISIHPNPADDLIIINGMSDMTTVSVTNAAGQIFKLQARSFNKNKSQVNIQSLPEGIYFLLTNGTRASFIKR